MVYGFSLGSNLAFLALALAIIPLNHAYQSSSYAPAPLPDGKLPDRQMDEIFYAVYATMALLLLVNFARSCIFQIRTILTVQVVLSARAGDIGIVLHDIAHSQLPNQTSLSKLNAAVNALLGHQKSFVYGSTSAKILRVHIDLRAGDSLETFVKKQLKKQGTRQRLTAYIEPKPAPKLDKDYTMVTIMALVNGNQQLPSIETIEDMKEAFNCLVTNLRTVKVDVIWAHRDPSSMQELLESSPNLNSILV